MDFQDILDLFVDPVFDLLLCRGNPGIWFKKRFISFLLAAGSVVFALILAFSIRSASWVGILVGAAGTILFAVLDWRYTFWWLREGRFGAELPVLDEIPIPGGDLNGKLTEEEKLRGEMEDRCRCLDKRMW